MSSNVDEWMGITIKKIMQYFTIRFFREYPELISKVIPKKTKKEIIKESLDKVEKESNEGTAFMSSYEWRWNRLRELLEEGK